MPPLPQVVDFLHPRTWAGMLEEFPLIEDLVGVRELFPIEPQPGDKLIWDLLKHDAPLAYFGAVGAESPILDQRPVLQQISVDMAYVKTKAVLNENDVRMLKTFGDAPRGTLIGDMRANSQKKITETLQRLDQSVDRRMEKNCIDSALGALTVTPALPENTGHSEITFTITWGVSTVQAGDAAGANNGKLWSDLTSDPLGDVSNWFQDLRYTISDAYMSKRVLNLLARNTTLRGNMLINTPVGQPSVVSQALIKRYFQEEMGVTIHEYNSQYTTRTVALSGGIPVYTDTVRRYLPDNKVIFKAAGPLGRYVTSPVPINNWQAGKYLIPIDPDESGKKDPYQWEALAGIYGLPVLYYPDRVFVATVA